MPTDLNTVAIDVRMIAHTGIGRYLCGLVSALESEPSNFKLSFFGPQSSKKKLGAKNSFQEINAPIYSISEQFEIPRLVHSQILHSPHYNAPILWKRKLVVTIHDLIHLHFAQHISWRARIYSAFMINKVTRRADAIISVSESTKRDLVQFCGVNPNKITVVHHGIDPKFQDSNSQKEHANYFLYVGLMKAHKNIGGLLDAHQKMENHIKLKLIGQPDLKQAVVHKWLKRIESNPNISLETNVNDQQLINAYRSATALILPSFYEGFGFPLLEAMALGVPVIAARSSSIPEVVGDAALLFDPRSSKELEKCMKSLLQSESLRRELIQKGFKRIRQFDWKSAAHKTKQVYESVL